MGVIRNHRSEPHRNPIRHSQTRMFAAAQDVGKGLYIGEVPPTYHHHERTSAAASPTATDATTRSRPWRSRGGQNRSTDDYSNRSYDTFQRQGEDGSADSGVYFPDQYSYRSRGTNTSSPASSSYSSTLYNPHSKSDKGSSPYLESPVSAFSNSGSPPHPRHNMTSFHNLLPSSIHRDVRQGSQSSPFASSPSLSSSNTNLLNLGVDHQASTVDPLQGPLHAAAAAASDPISATVEVPWNFTDDLCFNTTAGSYYNCWMYFDPNENETTTADPLLVDEYRYWTILLIIFPFFTVFGNVLVILSVFKEKSLKTVTNYFICSLAVADIMVAVIVMPFAVYMEVMNNLWMLSEPLCDAWVASDVLACTASILNLTAISVDRFIAVTQPIKYAKHKNSKRVFIMMAITWVISVAIAAPIALGVNYSEDRKRGDCRFFNSDFLIYSSMGSFYIPSIIMIFLYWKIYRVIRLRALKAMKAKQMRDVDKRALQGVIENPATVTAVGPNDTGGVYGAEATVTTGLAKMDNGRVTSYNTTTSTRATTSRFLSSQQDDDNSVTNVGTNSDDNSNDDDDDEESPSGSGSANNNTSANNPKTLGVASVVAQVNPKLLRNAEVAELITNPVAEELERLEDEEQQAMLQFGKNGSCSNAPEGSASTSGTAGGQTCANEAETPFTSIVCKGDGSDSHESGILSPKKKVGKRGQKKGVTKFNFHMRTSRKRKEKSSSRREKKATKTLAIVLGVFLACWVPFFTLNIISAICIRYDLDDLPACNMDPIYFSLFVWLGYINSFLNPVIYTIFNPEFRKAFRKILSEPCR